MPKPWFGLRLLHVLGSLIPSMFLTCKVGDSKRQQTEHNKRKITERELNNLNQKIVSHASRSFVQANILEHSHSHSFLGSTKGKLLDRLEDHEPEFANSPDEEVSIRNRIPLL
jgi:hypothetical protein